jgi:putative endonuclease
MTDKRKHLGQWGEDEAAKYLGKLGYKIIARNVRLSHKELDIIAWKNKITVFVEVKTRLDKGFGSQANPLSTRQIKSLKQAISMYVAKKKLDPNAVRLDLVCVDWHPDYQLANIKHFSDIF